MTTKRVGGGAERDPDALLHALEVHQAELEVQNGELQAANEELRRSNEELMIARDRFRALYELAPTPYVTIDAGRTIVELNPAGESLLATPRERLVGGQIDLFVDDSGRTGFRDFVENVFAAGHARCSDVALVRAGAAPLDVLIDGVLVREAAGTSPRCVLALIDITARKQVETARRRAQDEVLAIVSHDLRGPISAIGLACDALDNPLDPVEHAECVAAIKRSAARCERLIRDLLGVAHIESGRLQLDVAPFDVNGLVQQVCRDHLSAATAGGTKLTVSTAPTPAPIVGDQDRLHQALSNLIGNALVHARGAAVEVSVAERGSDVVIAVADDGPGIPADELPFIFERYRQGARRSGGAGLGLAIVKGLVEAHHGNTAVTSRLGRGSRFEVVLPRAP